MRPFTLLTWNINSVRLRLPLLLHLAETERPDIILLQETKTEDAFFPAQAIKAAGYPYLAFRGEKSYNGVAILSKIPFSRVYHEKLAGEEDCRHIAAVLDSGAHIHNFYIPAGGDIPDPQENPKFAHKLRSAEWLAEYFSVSGRSENAVLAGDLNIAPGEFDVWSHKQLLKIVSHTPPETSRLNEALAAGKWHDIARETAPASRRIYSWWSYRNRDWRKSNRGRRLDHIWCGAAFRERLTRFETLPYMRDARSPSDHIPVKAVFDANAA